MKSAATTMISWTPMVVTLGIRDSLDMDSAVSWCWWRKRQSVPSREIHGYPVRFLDALNAPFTKNVRRARFRQKSHPGDFKLLRRTGQHQRGQHEVKQSLCALAETYRHNGFRLPHRPPWWHCGFISHISIELQLRGDGYGTYILMGIPEAKTLTKNSMALSRCVEVIKPKLAFISWKLSSGDWRFTATAQKC